MISQGPALSSPPVVVTDLSLNDDQVDMLCVAAPYVTAMTQRLGRNVISERNRGVSSDSPVTRWWGPGSTTAPGLWSTWRKARYARYSVHRMT
jgi:hypothetical protein